MSILIYPKYSVGSAIYRKTRQVRYILSGAPLLFDTYSRSDDLHYLFIVFRRLKIILIKYAKTADVASAKFYRTAQVGTQSETRDIRIGSGIVCIRKVFNNGNAALLTLYYVVTDMYLGIIFGIKTIRHLPLPARTEYTLFKTVV